MKRPLLPVAVLYIGGILCGEVARLPLPFLFGASFLAAGCALVIPTVRPYLLGLLLVLTGWTGACWNTAILAPDDLRSLVGERGMAVRLRGVVVAPPAERIFERGQREISHFSVLIATQAIALDDKMQPAFGKVIAGAPGVLPENVFDGQTVEISGVLKPPNGPLAARMFDARAYYARQGVFYQLEATSTNDFQIPKDANVNPPIFERFRRWAMKTLALGLREEDDALRLTWTLFLDWKTPLTPQLEEPFMRAGTYHIFAVDGLRIGLLAGIGIGILRLFRVRRMICGLIVLPILWFYVALTGWPASAIRAAIMLSVIIAGWALRRPSDLVNSLCAAALIILVWQPEQLFQAGFQLSFLVMLCIALIVPPVNDWVRHNLFKGDPMLPDTLQPRMPKLLSKPAFYLMETFLLSFAAWIGSIPLAAYYFHLFTPISILANCLVVPATALALIGGICSLLTAGWLPGLAILFNNSTWGLMKFILWSSRSAAHLPDSNFNVAAPSTVFCLFYYAVLIVIVTGWIFRSRYKWAGVAVIIVTSIYLTSATLMARRTAHLHILPLKGAPVIFVDSPTQEGNVLVNCADADSATIIVKPFLCAQGVNRLHAVCLAVALMPHFAGAKVILDNFPADGVFIGSAEAKSKAYENLVKDLRPKALRDGDTVARWSVLNPGASDNLPRSENTSIVFRKVINNRSILLLPSLAREGQENLMQRHPNLRADIVIAGLPTRDEPLCDPLLDILNAKLIIIADTEFPANRRASATLRQRLARRAEKVVYCHDNGSLTLDLSPSSYELHTATGANPRYAN
jgi:competence protein ComEC